MPSVQRALGNRDGSGFTPAVLKDFQGGKAIQAFQRGKVKIIENEEPGLGKDLESFS